MNPIACNSQNNEPTRRLRNSIEIYIIIDTFGLISYLAKLRYVTLTLDQSITQFTFRPNSVSDKIGPTVLAVLKCIPYNTSYVGRSQSSHDLIRHKLIQSPVPLINVANQETVCDCPIKTNVIRREMMGWQRSWGDRGRTRRMRMKQSHVTATPSRCCCGWHPALNDAVASNSHAPATDRVVNKPRPNGKSDTNRRRSTEIGR